MRCRAFPLIAFAGRAARSGRKPQRPPGRDRLLLLCLLAGWGGCFAFVAVAPAAASKEDQIKAAFLYNFTKFVEWPAGRFANARSPIVIGVLASDPVAAELATLVKDRQVNGRAVVVTPVATLEELRSAHVVFVSTEEEAKLGNIAEAMNGAAVLTVGETERFTAQGGMIAFTREADKVRFAINLESSERAGLKISAQLLKLATRIWRKA